jgi:uncharacterized protein
MAQVTPVDKRIVSFLKKHHVLTLATSVDNKPYCANCFYAYLEAENCLVFTSDVETKHVTDALNNSMVAGSVVLETRIVGKIQGLQFCGEMQRAEGELLSRASAVYLKRFPYAALMKTTLWVVHFSFLKFTDNNLGFGKKITWNKA